jgi:hypothetical protein
MMIEVQLWQRTTSFIDRIKRICGDSLQHFYLLAGITGPFEVIYIKLLIAARHKRTVLKESYGVYHTSDGG